MTALLTNRPIDKVECPWLDADIPAGTLLYECTAETYGCIEPDGVAATRDPQGGYPFFQVPRDAVTRDPS